MAAGIATQLLRPEAVWRRRCAEGGIGALQGLAAGIVGMELLGDGRSVFVAAAAGVGAAFLVNTAGRFFVILERDPQGLVDRWPRGIVVDAAEAVLVAPLIAVLVTAAVDSEPLTAATVVSVTAIMLLAERSRDRTAAALLAEQANARRDQLTGAPNRRAFEEAMAAEHARVIRGAVPAGLFVVDLDRFKSINDRFGHGVGDQVLVEVVQRLVEGLRPTDVVARWGGEEIAVLAPGVKGRRQLEQFAERIRTLIGALPFATTTTALPITVSVGGTLLDGSVSPVAAFERADRALYDAKRTRDAAAVILPARRTLWLEAS